jgi:hypothetical protein
LTPNPIIKVLSTLRSCRVRFLLMGGQACVFYGAAEFSRDTDIVILASTDNLDRFNTALTDLQAERIAVPPFEPDYLTRGHAVHFRCRRADASGMRIDVMAVLRGVAPFDELWKRRTTIQTPDGDTFDLLALPDLVQAKKTQRDKDWPMLRRLVEVHYLSNREHPTTEVVSFWLRELRTPVLLTEVVCEHPEAARVAAVARPLLDAALQGGGASVERALVEEEQRERDADRRYWQPLREELERLRHAKG